MRDIRRQKPIILALARLWFEQPDLRFTQLLENVIRFGGGSMDNFFYIEDTELRKYIDNYDSIIKGSGLH